MSTDTITVLCSKQPGVDIVFTVAPDKATAARVVAQLARVGLVARAVPSVPTDVQGIRRRRASAKRT